MQEPILPALIIRIAEITTIQGGTYRSNLILAELEKFAATNPQIVDELHRVAKIHGVDSKAGRKHTVIEHWILNCISDIFFDLRHGNNPAETIRRLIKNYGKVNQFSHLKKNDPELFLSFKDCLESIADRLGIKYRTPTSGRMAAARSL